MFLFFLVTFSNDLLIPVPIVNIKVKEEPAISTGKPNTDAYEAILTGKPNTDAYEAILKVLNDAYKVISILSR